MNQQSPPRSLPLAARSNPGKYTAVGTARLINLYVEEGGQDGKVQFPLLAVPGLTDWVNLTTGAVRGIFKVDDTLALVVCGVDIIAIDQTGVWRTVGGIPGTGPVYFARNRRSAGVQVAIVSGGAKRCYDASTDAATTITDVDLPDAIGCDAISAYVLYFIADGRVFYSGINDATAIGALSFIEAESRPDGLVRGIVHEMNVWLFGPDSTEIWGLTNDADAPLARLSGAAIEQGCKAAASVTKVQLPSGARLAWVSNDLTVRMSNGYQGERISTHAVERAISSCAAPQNIEAFSYAKDGHIFLVLNASEWSWVYNATTGLWHEEKSYGKDRRRWAFAMDFAGKTICGDFERPKLYEISNAVSDDAGEPLVCEVYTPIDHAYPNDIEYNALYIDTLPGTGLTGSSVERETPRIGVRWSFDGGMTYGNWRLLETGKAGRHKTRVATHMLGTSGEDGAAFHILWSAGVARAITGAAVDSQIVRA